MLIHCCIEGKRIPSLSAACRKDSLPFNIKRTVCSFSSESILFLHIKCPLPSSKRFYYFSCLPRREHIKVDIVCEKHTNSLISPIHFAKHKITKCYKCKNTYQKRRSSEVILNPPEEPSFTVALLSAYILFYS